MSVLVGSDPTTAPRYSYVIDGHSNVVTLTDASGNAVATYAYDEFGAVTIDAEHFANGWHRSCNRSCNRSCDLSLAGSAGICLSLWPQLLRCGSAGGR